MQKNRKCVLGCRVALLFLAVGLLYETEILPTVAWAQEAAFDGNQPAFDAQSSVLATPFQPEAVPAESSSAAYDLQPLPPVQPLGDLTAGSTAAPTFGGGFGMGMGSGMGLGMGGGQGPISYKTTWFPNAAVQGQSANWGMVGQDFSFMAPVSSSSPSTVMLTGGVSNRLIDTDATMPDSGRAYPDNLWNVRLGLMYMRQLDEGRMFSAGVNVGSASDRPFGSIEEMNVSLMAMYRRPSGERNAWTFGVVYSPTSEIQFPIPMISYFWNPSDTFQANVGLPFMLRYRPDDRWTFEASYMLIHTINVKGSYRLTDRLKIVGGYSSTDEVYMLYDRTDVSDRFFMYDQRVSLGLESPVAKWLTVDLTGGYAFGRYSYTGQQWDSAQFDRIDIANGPFVMFHAQLRR